MELLTINQSKFCNQKIFISALSQFWCYLFILY